MTLGDVLAVISGILGLAATWAAVLMATALLFPSATERAQRLVQHRPIVSFLIGTLVFLPLGPASVLRINAPNGAVKVLGWLLCGWLFTRLFVGGAGLAQLMAERIGDRSPDCSSFRALVCSCGILTVAMFFPLIGWFILAPVAGLCALGAGVAAMRLPWSWSAPRREPIPVLQEVEAL